MKYKVLDSLRKTRHLSNSRLLLKKSGKKGKENQWWMGATLKRGPTAATAPIPVAEARNKGRLNFESGFSSDLS